MAPMPAPVPRSPSPLLPSLVLLAVVACGDAAPEDPAEARPAAAPSSSTKAGDAAASAVDARLRDVTEEEFDAYLATLEALHEEGEDFGVNIDAGWKKIIAGLEKHRWSPEAKTVAAEHGLDGDRLADVHFNVVLAVAYIVREPATKIERSFMRVKIINTGKVPEPLKDAPEVPRRNRRQARQNRERFVPLFGIASVETDGTDEGVDDEG